MATIPEVKQKAKQLLWIDEDKDAFEVENIISECNIKAYDGRLLKDCKISPNGKVEVVLLTDHPLFKIHQYFYNKYGEDDGMVVYYRWLWKVGLSSPEEGV